MGKELGKFDGVLLVSDFDDTLYDSTCTVSQKNTEAIRYFTGEGGFFTVATGRAHSTFAGYAALAPMNCPAVLSNGAGLYDFAADRMICETFLPVRAQDDLAELLAAFPTLGCEAYHGDEIFVQNPNEVTQRHLARNRAPWTECILAQHPIPWNKIVLEQERAVLEQVRAYLLKYHAADYEIIFSHQYLLELTAKGSSKGGMVLRLADYLGVSQGNIYCVGDNENDLSMLACGAIGFAPANCAAIVQQSGARLVGSCDESCVAEIIGILDGIYPQKE